MTDKSENEALAAKIRAEQLKMAPDQINMAPVNRRDKAELESVAPREPGVMDEQFPTDALTSYDERDKVMEAKLQLQDPDRPGYTQFGKLDAKDEDFKWLQKKQAAVEAANFQAWFAKEFDKMSPAQKKRAKELYPDFYAQRKRLLKQQTKNLFDLARIKLEGIESKEDLLKTYMAETGRLDLGPLQNLMHPEAADTIWSTKPTSEVFQRGLMNPFSVFGKEAYPQTHDNREVQSKDFANRADLAVPTGLGTQGGFPPMRNRTAGDMEWYQALQQGL